MFRKTCLTLIALISLLITSVKAQVGQLYFPKPPLAELPDGKYLLLGDTSSFIRGDAMGAMFLEKIGNRVVGVASDFPNQEVLGCFKGKISSNSLLVDTSIAIYSNSRGNEGWTMVSQRRLDLGKLTQPAAAWGNQIAQESRTRNFFPQCKTMFSGSATGIQSLASLTDGIHLLATFPGYAPYGEEYYAVEKRGGSIVVAGGLAQSDDDVCFGGRIGANRQVTSATIAYYETFPGDGLVRKNNQRFNLDFLNYRLSFNQEFIDVRREIAECKQLLN